MKPYRWLEWFIGDKPTTPLNIILRIEQIYLFSSTNVVMSNTKVLMFSKKYTNILLIYILKRSTKYSVRNDF